jgi:hypothetical protein
LLDDAAQQYAGEMFLDRASRLHVVMRLKIERGDGRLNAFSAALARDGV